ncbi:MAG: penicillin-binding transpeptidase domain-containing protein [Pseudomonadota bacterium]
MKRKRIRLLVSCMLLLILFTASISGIGGGTDRASETKRPVAPIASMKMPDKPDTASLNPFTRSEITSVLGSQFIPTPLRDTFSLRREGHTFRVHTSIDTSLQNWISSKLDLNTTEQIGVVILEPSTGRILTVSGHDKMNPSSNPCFDSRFPAASIFKIVTAVAAVEKYGFTPSTTFTYYGRKHTLYRSQLKGQKSKYTQRITLRDSFAQSVNPVFGKLGIHYLEKDDIEKYALSFGFNQPIPFDCPVSPSSFVLDDDLFNRAEIASGFNRRTTLSPLHGALMASAILNRGSLLEPTLIDEIIDESGEPVYRRQKNKIGQAMSPETAAIMLELMTATIRSGTSRKAFRGYLRDKILSSLIIGGKTGSISSYSNEIKYDWFVGFAGRKNKEDAIAISVLVAHDGHVGKKASSYARMAIKAYFENSLEKRMAGIDSKRAS